MPILENQRHELFAQELAKGKSASEAYVSSGYKPSRKNAARLRANEGVKARLAELQAVSARSTAITIESICAELDQANQVAMERGQAAAMVSASTLRAKLGGLMVEKVEVGGPGDFTQAETYAELADSMLDEIKAMYRPVSDEDREGLTELLERQGGELGEYLASIKARPINGMPENPLNVIAREDRMQRQRRRRLLTGSNGQE